MHAPWRACWPGCSLPVAAAAQGANAKPAPGSPTADRLPIYEVDPTWPPTLPNDWILGDIRGLFVDDRDHLWVIHMPSSLTPQEIGAAVKPPIADCCVPAPPVLELDPEGKVLRAWGGPGEGYTWFDQEHGIYIDHNGFVWMGTSNGMHVMKFTQDGKHLLTIGEPGVNKGSNDPDHLGGPANFYVEPKTNELFIADGYINKRVVVYDAATGKYKRHWGAYGKRPDDTEKYSYPVNPANPPQRYSTLHGLVGIEGRPHLRVGPPRQPHPGVPAERRVPDGAVRPAGDRRFRERLQPAVLARRGAEPALPHRRHEPARLDSAPQGPGDSRSLRPARTPGRRVHPRAHDRDRLEEPDVHRRGRQRPPHAALDPEGHEAGGECHTAAVGSSFKL